MATYTDAEIDYLREQRLARLATVDEHGRPQIAPVGVHYDARLDAIVVTGRDFARSKKFRNAAARPDVAYLVDDLAAVDPWTPRGLEVRAHAEAHDAAGGREAVLVLRPRRILSWGLDSGPFDQRARDVGREAAAR